MEQLRHDLDTVVGKFARKYVALVAVTVRDDMAAMTGRGHVNDTTLPPTNDTLFHVGSVTNLFSGLLLADLVRTGETSLDTPVAEFFPDVRVPVHGRPITLADLATHTSALPNLPRSSLPWAVRHGSNALASIEVEDLERALGATRLRRDPGERRTYSTFGVALLGEAMSRMTGRTYEDLVLDRICAPLGMHDTVSHLAPGQERRLARSYTRTGRSVIEDEPPTVVALGGLYSTAADMSTFLRAQLSPPDGGIGEAIRVAQAPRTNSGRPVSMGLGWTRSRLRHSDQLLLWHNGCNGGSCSFIGFVPGWSDGVVVLTNSPRPVDLLGWDLLRAIGPAGAVA